MKKLITVCWSVTQEVEIPENSTINSLNDFNGLHADEGAAIIKNLSDNIEWKSGEITDISDVYDPAHDYLDDKQIKELKGIVRREKRGEKTQY